MSVASLNRAHGEAELALALAAAGLAVIPVHLHRQGERWCKDPLIKDWRNRASADARMVQGWWRQFPFAVPGIVLARCGLVIVDADRHPGKPDGVAALAVLDGLPPHPVIATRGGGEHHYFRQPVPISFGRWLGGEVLGTSKFAVAYAMIDPAMVPALPAGLLRALPKEEARGKDGGFKAYPRTFIGGIVDEGEVANLTDALRQIDPRDFRNYEDWFALAGACKAVGISRDDFAEWCLRDEAYAGTGEENERIWDSAHGEHGGALWKALAERDIPTPTNNKSPGVRPKTRHPSSSRPQASHWLGRVKGLRASLRRDQCEASLFSYACLYAEILYEEGRASPDAFTTAQSLLEGDCPKLIAEFGIAEVRRTIANAFARIASKLEPQS
jgi:Bifunctional DNA primase/polymerase, N-terminal/Primase C terminal 2 (PriCT-2)